MIKVGLTGGLGAGKSTISKLFKEFKVPVFNSDLCARDGEKDPKIQEAFKRILGDDIFVNGVLDRDKMRGIIFVDKDKLKEINEVVIPFITSEFEKFVNENINSPYVILESAILFETGSEKLFNYIITVTCNVNTRINRVIKRDKSSVQDIQNKIGNQWPENKKVINSHYVIVNEGNDLLDSLDILTKQVHAVNDAIMYRFLIGNID
jgi:dephospho-CoA kinase